MVLHGKIRYNLSFPERIIISEIKQLTFAEQQNWTDWLCQVKGTLFSLENLFWKLKFYQHVHFRKYFVDVFDTCHFFTCGLWKLWGFILHMMACISFYSQFHGHSEQHLLVVFQPPWSNLLQETSWAYVRLSTPQRECPFSVGGCWVISSSPIGCQQPSHLQAPLVFMTSHWALHSLGKPRPQPPVHLWSFNWAVLRFLWLTYLLCSEKATCWSYTAHWLSAQPGLFIRSGLNLNKQTNLLINKKEIELF